MVSALFRKTEKFTDIQSNMQTNPIQIRLIKTFDKANCQMGEAELLPSALREFVNSNADLPTIEELVDKLPILKHIAEAHY